jgi:signal transduction histidine kinase
MNSSALIDSTEDTLPTYGERLALPTLAPEDAVPVLRGMAALVACRDLQELATESARLLAGLFGAGDVVVQLRGVQTECSGVGAQTSPALKTWANELLAAGPPAVARRDERWLAARIGSPDAALKGVVAVALGEPDLDGGQLRMLEAAASLIAPCCSRLPDVRSIMERGLHDLCTPLNSVRLGLQLLEPALSNHDPAVAQRVHRAVDRMAKLVEEMFAQLDPR